MGQFITTKQLSDLLNLPWKYLPPLATILKQLSCIILTILLINLILKINYGYATPSNRDLTQLNLEQLMNIRVTGASKYSQKLSEAPADVSIVTADQIKKLGFRTLAEILRSVRGLYFTYDRNYSYQGIRGFGRFGDYNSRILLLVDGHRINDNIYDSALIGNEFPLDIDLIKRVEIIRGPGSSLYGTNAFFAVINVITRNGRGLKGFEVAGAGGSFGTYRTRVSYGNKFANGLEVLVSGSTFGSPGHDLYFPQFDSPDTNNGIAHNCDFEWAPSAFTKIAYRDFLLTGLYQIREKGIPTGTYDVIFNDPRNLTDDMRAYVEFKYEHAFANQWKVMARLYYDRYNYDGTYINSNDGDPTLPPVIKNRDLGRGSWWGEEVQVTKTLFKRHKVIVGSEYRDNLRQNQYDYDEYPLVQYINDKRTSQIYAFYGQDEYTILKNLRLNVGLRYDHYQTFGGSLNPRAAIIYNPFAKTTLKFIYGEAFRAPNCYELYYQDGGYTQEANPNLQPEKIRTYNLVLEQLFWKHYRAVVSGYFYHINDLITQQVDPNNGLLVFENTDRVNAKGIELGLQGRWENGLQGNISYTLQDTRNAATGSLLENSPTHLAKLNLIVPVYHDKLFAGLELLYMSSRKTLGNSHVGDHVIGNLTLYGHKFIKNLQLSASVYNIFNQKYYDPGGDEHLANGMYGIQQDGITFRLKAVYSFW